ncbi:50S ribosomal protein L11 [Candidatus Pacearchaeota archaeon CG10_big_fil_rev_8_21_14_0_10_32_42]|nr:MAG: 50S ribosomal protein L11 [Candidatus Pacearchaeota archaeon CG10_big_fil_rev_8_21_14_0_10_32_42]
MNVKLLVDGGAMKPGPALSQKLGPAGIPINQVIEKINSATASFKGMQVPVEIEVDVGKKTFEIQVFSPPVSGLIKKEAGITKGSGMQDKSKAGNLSIEQVISVAKAKRENLLSRSLKSAVKTVVGSCVSLGILIENMDPVEIEKLIEEGKYDKEIKEEKVVTSSEKKAELEEFFNKLKTEQDKKLKEETKQKEEAEAAAPEKKEKTPEKAPAKVPAKK